MEHVRTTRRETRLGLLLVILAVAAVLAVAANPDGAAACTRTSLDGEIRTCTWTENLGDCLRDVEDAYWQCRRDNPGFVGAVRCSLASNFDQVACLVQSGVFAISRPVVGS